MLHSNKKEGIYDQAKQHESPISEGDKYVKYLSLFSGIGGFELGIIKATCICGSDGLFGCAMCKAECVGYSEVDKYAISVYERNFSGHRNYGDATKIDARGLPDFNLVVGGFPCQAFSIAGKRAGFNDTRGTLFFDIARILKDKRPGHLVLENVKGLLSHDCGKTFQTILGVLSDLGYRVEWQVLNSKGFGVPQNRERIYIVGHLGGECGREVFPITGGHRETIQEGHEQPVSGTLSTKNQSGQAQWDGSTTLVANRQGVQIERFKPDFEYESRGQESPLRIRRLTPKECERLQGFPDDWTLIGVEWTKDWPKEKGYLPLTVEISDTQRYKMCGNAVTVNTVEAVIKKLKPCLEATP